MPSGGRMNVLNNMIRDHWINQNPDLLVEIEEARDLGDYEAPTCLTLHIENAISGTRLSISLPRSGRMVARYEGGVEIEREIDLTDHITSMELMWGMTRGNSNH